MTGVPGDLEGYPRANKIISWVQFSPSAHTRWDFFLQKSISGKRESVS